MVVDLGLVAEGPPVLANGVIDPINRRKRVLLDPNPRPSGQHA